MTRGRRLQPRPGQGRCSWRATGAHGRRCAGSGLWGRAITPAGPRQSRAESENLPINSLTPSPSSRRGEFLSRFLLHVLPDGFVRIRHFGLLANRARAAKLARCRALLAAGAPAVPPAPETVAALMLRLTGVDITCCPVCREGRLHVVALLRPAVLPVPVGDTS